MLISVGHFSGRGLFKWIAGFAAIGLVFFSYDQFWPAPDLGPPKIISRAEWGAEQADPRLEPDQDPEVFNTVVVHHSAMLLSEGPRDIQSVHMHQRGFLDIGYHFVIDGEGRIYEGRSLATHGAHVAGHNAGTLGIALMGNYEIIEPATEQRVRLKWLIQALMRKYPLTHLAGHGAFAPGKTLCPGKNLEALLPTLAKELGLKFGVGGYVGPGPGAPALNPAL